MTDQIESAEKEIRNSTLTDDGKLEAYRLRYLSRNGLIAKLFDQFKSLPPQEKAQLGRVMNELKTLAETTYRDAKTDLEDRASTAEGRPAAHDLTLPVRPTPIGSMHPLSRVQLDMREIFNRLGFTVADGPEIEDDFHNFTALNFPEDHPARDMQDTFFLRKDRPGEQDLVLRTHTSPVQIRLMKRQAPPIRAVMPGRVFRNEAVTYKSYFQFNQIEGLVVDRHVTMADLIQTLVTFAKMMYGESVEYRVRSSFFPFTEPSIEMDVRRQEGDGGWMEILGAGMVDPNVLDAVGIDPEVFNGYAFGMGIDRIAMLKYGFDDIRTLYENDVRMLGQFPL